MLTTSAYQAIHGAHKLGSTSSDGTEADFTQEVRWEAGWRPRNKLRWNKKLPYFLAHKTHRPIRCTVIFSLEILEKNNDECILILVIYWKKTGLLNTKISNHNINYSSQKPRKSSSLPLKSPSWLFSLDAGMGIYKFRNNIYPQRIRRRSNLGHIFRGKKCVLWAGKYGAFCPRK